MTRSSAIRRLNYTDRQRIRHEDVSITLHSRVDNETLAISALLNLRSYSLPPDARVFVEAHRETIWQRFELGTVASPTIVREAALVDFGTGDGIRFRAKVVGVVESANGVPPILARADGIRPKLDGPRPSLLPLQPDPDLRDEVWRLIIDDDDGPIIKVSTELVSDRRAFARSPAFVSLALPEIFRSILKWSLNGDLPADDDWDTPRGRWIRLACALLGQAEVPPGLGDSETDGDARDAWIDDAVSRFCKVNSVNRVFSQWIDESQVRPGTAP